MFRPIPRAGGTYARPGLNAYSFLGLLNANAKDPSTGIDLFGVCDFCAEHDIDGADLTGYFFPGYPAVPDDRYLARLKRHAQHRGLHLIGTGVRNDFTTSDKAVREAGVRHLKAWIEVAAKLGASTVRAFADSQAPFKSWQEASGDATRETVEMWMADALRECADHGERFGVLVAVQNHGDFIRTGEQHLSLLRRVDHDWCAAMVDTGMYLTDDPYVDFAVVAPYAVTWQIKETTRSRLDSPRLDLARFAAIVYASGYRGYLPIETLPMGRADYDPYAEVTTLLTGLRRALAKIAPTQR
jgi:sugar phosphate isomerase/epimerase